MMKCIKCNKDAKKKDRDNYGGKCPSCKHSFVTDPAYDSLTDVAVKTAENLVTSDGIFYFLKKHLYYQLLRRAKKKLRWWTWATIIFFLIFTSSTAYAIQDGTPIVAIISGICFLVTLVSRFSLKNHITRIRTIVDKWIKINPNEKLLTTKKSASVLNKQTDKKDLEEISFDRVLICEKDEFVDFFLANLFHFHYSCPVLGGNNYPSNVCADMLRRLKKNQQLDVFLLHDYTPEGYAFANRIKSDSHWFGNHSEFNVVDLGMLEEQQSMFKSMSIKQKDLPERSGRYKASRANKKIAELSVFKPETLITLCGIAINEKVPLHKISSNINDSSGGYG